MNKTIFQRNYLPLLLSFMGIEAGVSAQDMAFVPAGSFMMGDALDDESNREHPTNAVYVSAFYMDRTDVTKALWDEVRQWALAHGYSFENPGSGDVADHPVHTISWYDAVKWCNARSEREGRTPAYYTNAAQTMVYTKGQVAVRNDWVNWNAGYRLPTEAEWEKAARGGAEGHRFPWSNVDTITHTQANYISDPSYAYDLGPETGYHPAFRDTGTSPVTYFPPNGYGIYDMAGNVWQWCWDWYGDYSSSPVTDPRGPTTVSFRVNRGGSWDQHAWDCRTAARSISPPSNIDPATYRDSNLGFRCVRIGIRLADVGALNGPLASQPTYSCLPAKEPGKDCLVVITHGYQPLWETPDVSWVDTMKNSITTNLAERGLHNWQVVAYEWVEKAQTVVPDSALANGAMEGGNLGLCISTQGWNHVHLIGHSAGSALIQSASLIIKSNFRGTTSVHTTFLDAYVGAADDWKGLYGQGADWADSYFSHDLETFGEFYRWTEGPLDDAYNVDVTWLDPNKVHTVGYRSGSEESCYQTVSSHGWPIEFYQATITNALFGDGYGFPLSKEGGNWDYATNHYGIGNNPPYVLGTPDPSCVENVSTIPLYLDAPLHLDNLPFLKSDTGTVEIRDRSLTARTDSPVWLALGLTVTNAINFIAFEASFTSSNGAAGLLSVYWNTNSVGVIDERVGLPGLHHYTFLLPGVFTNGDYVLGLRLDPFSTTASSILVTNITSGLHGLREPCFLSVAQSLTNGMRLLTLNGPAGYNYVAEVSTNLIHWEPIAALVNTNGTVNFFDVMATSLAPRFYRAVAP